VSKSINFKRISLVLVSALAMGVLSFIPSAQAYVTGTPTVTVTNGTATKAKSDSTTAAKISVAFTSNSATRKDSAVIMVTSVGTAPTGATWDTASMKVSGRDTSGGTVQAKLYGADGTLGTEWTASNATRYGVDSATPKTTGAIVVVSPLSSGANGPGTFGGTMMVFIDTLVTRVVGTYVVNYAVQYYSEGVLSSSLGNSGSVNIVVSDSEAAASGAVTSSSTSSAYMYTGTSFAGTAQTFDSTISAVSTPTGTAVGFIQVKQLTADSLPSQESITVTIDKGNVGSSSGSASGKSVVFEANTNGLNNIFIFGDGNSGTATITVKTTSVTFATKTVTWYGDTVASITATKLANTVSGSSAVAIVAVAKDAQGNQITADSNVYAYSSDLNVFATHATLTTSSSTECTYSAVYGGHICQLSAASNGTANITLRNKSTTALATVASSAVAVTGNTRTPVAIKLATDKTSYAPGEAIYLRVWAVDSLGNPVGNGTQTNLLASGGITSTVALGNSSDTTTAVTFALAATTASSGYASAEPIKLYKLYAPYTSGDITFKATGGTLLPAAGQVEVSTKVSVANSGEAAAAQALAAVTALASQVSAFITKINAQITTLTDLVMKIQKKVKA
jgi:hypothetical protein